MSVPRFFYGWVIVGAGILITCVGLGAMFSLSIFLKPISEAMGWSRTGISTVALLNFAAMGIGAFVWGALSDRIGTRTVVLCGGVLLGSGLMMASRAATLGQFQLWFGVVGGFAVGAFYAPMTAAVSLYLFTRELSSFYAVALVFGLAYGGVMPLYAIVVREYFGERIMGMAYGAVSFVSTVGMSLEPWAGGWLYDVFGSYFWLYVGSCGIGLGAAAIALTIRPPSDVPAALLSSSRAT